MSKLLRILKKAWYGPYLTCDSKPSIDRCIRLDECLLWGGAYVPRSRMDPHSLIVGTTRSGKTWLLRMLMRSALLFHDDERKCPIEGRLKTKAVIYDGKNELLPLLPAIGIPEDRIFNLNPYHVGCHGWDIAKDITTQTSALHAANALFPDRGEQGENAFFPQAARGLLTAVMFSYIKSGNTTWTLYEALRTSLDQQAMKHLFEQMHDEYIIRMIRENYLELHKRTLDGIIGNLTQFILPLWPIANLWQNQRSQANTDRAISLRDWVYEEGPSVLVLSRKAEARTVLDAVNHVLLSRLFDYIQGFQPIPEQKNAMPDDPRLWMFFDELHLAGELEFLPELMTLSAGQGCPIALSFQDIKSLHHLYGEAKAELMADMCGNTAGLRVTSFPAADWLSRRFGAYEYYENSFTSGTSTNADGKETSSVSHSRQLKERFWIPAHILQNGFQITTESTGLEGAYRIPGIDERSADRHPLIWFNHIPAADVARLGGSGRPMRIEGRPETDEWDHSGQNGFSVNPKLISADQPQQSVSIPRLRRRPKVQ